MAFVAINIPTQPAAAEKLAPITKHIAAFQPTASAPCSAGINPKTVSKTPIPIINGIIILYSLLKKVIAPLCIYLCISSTLSLVILTFDTFLNKTKTYSNVIKVEKITSNKQSICSLMKIYLAKFLYRVFVTHIYYTIIYEKIKYLIIIDNAK